MISNKFLDSLGGKHKQILAFDCEFWHVLGESGDLGYEFPPDKDFFFMPREVGGILLTKKNTKWELSDPFFITLSPPKRDVAFPISKYSNVSHATTNRLDKLEESLGLAWGDAFPSRLSPEGKKAHDEGLIVYEKDHNIKKAHKTQNWYSDFMKLYSNSVVIVKGEQDLHSFQNAAKYYGFKYKKPVDVIDIALWNPESQKLCRSAKLERTFKCIRKKLDSETRELEKLLPLESAHDPTTDASMTLLIALYIESHKPL
jgi:hypothetical protein